MDLTTECEIGLEEHTDSVTAWIPQVGNRHVGAVRRVCGARPLPVFPARAGAAAVAPTPRSILVD
jgi:hypothetical protein